MSSLGISFPYHFSLSAPFPSLFSPLVVLFHSLFSILSFARVALSLASLSFSLFLSLSRSFTHSFVLVDSPLDIHSFYSRRFLSFSLTLSLSLCFSLSVSLFLSLLNSFFSLSLASHGLSLSLSVVVCSLFRSRHSFSVVVTLSL